jgi:hypothetical protein
MNPFPRKPSRLAGGYRRSAAVTIRWATPADARQLEILAQLDEAPVPPAPVLLAFVGGELWVARSAGTGAVISDPFRPSAEVADLVRERGRQLTVSGRGRPRLRVMRLLSQPR